MRKSDRMKKWIMAMAMLVLPGVMLTGQTMPEIMETGSLEEQKSWLEEKTNIYNGYRAVRDDIFLKMMKNSLDSLNNGKQVIAGLEGDLKELQTQLDNQKTELETTRENLKEAIRNRDSLSFFGISMAKGVYNLILWGIILGLVAVLVFGVLFYRRIRSLNQEIKKDLKDTMNAFEEFRKTSREKSEQMVISHFNEIKRLKEGN